MIAHLIAGFLCSTQGGRFEAASFADTGWLELTKLLRGDSRHAVADKAGRELVEKVILKKEEVQTRFKFEKEKRTWNWND